MRIKPAILAIVATVGIGGGMLTNAAGQSLSGTKRYPPYPANLTDCDRLATSRQDQGKHPEAPTVSDGKLRQGAVEALAVCTSALAATPDSGRLLTLTARIYDLMGEATKAREAYRLGSEVGSYDAMMEYARMLAMGEGGQSDLENARRWMRRASDLEREAPNADNWSRSLAAIDMDSECAAPDQDVTDGNPSIFYNFFGSPSRFAVIQSEITATARQYKATKKLIFSAWDRLHPKIDVVKNVLALRCKDGDHCVFVSSGDTGERLVSMKATSFIMKLCSHDVANRASKALAEIIQGSGTGKK